MGCMGLNPGRKRRNLVDMTSVPEKFEYVVSEDALEGLDYSVPLGGGTVLQVRTMERDYKVVDFSLNQFVEPEYEGNYSGRNVDVARIDCCHSEVHRHQFYRDGHPQNRYVIHDLKCEPDHENAENVVNRCYDSCYEEMTDNWESHLERWENGSV